LNIKDSAIRKTVSSKTLIEYNGCSIIEINNAGVDPLSPCPKGVKLEKQFCCAVLDKDVTCSLLENAGAILLNSHYLRVAP